MLEFKLSAIFIAKIVPTRTGLTDWQRDFSGTLVFNLKV